MVLLLDAPNAALLPIQKRALRPEKPQHNFGFYLSLLSTINGQGYKGDCEGDMNWSLSGTPMMFVQMNLVREV